MNMVGCFSNESESMIGKCRMNFHITSRYETKEKRIKYVNAKVCVHAMYDIACPKECVGG
jgi:hypothetical protein